MHSESRPGSALFPFLSGPLFWEFSHVLLRICWRPYKRGGGSRHASPKKSEEMRHHRRRTRPAVKPNKNPDSSRSSPSWYFRSRRPLLHFVYGFLRHSFFFLLLDGPSVSPIRSWRLLRFVFTCGDSRQFEYWSQLSTSICWGNGFFEHLNDFVG